MAQDIDIKDLVQKGKMFVTEMTDTLLAIYAEKGIEPFKKPLTITLPLLLVLYLFVYRPLGSKLVSASAELERGRAIADGAGDYESARTQLAAFQRRLPPAKEKDEWLNAQLASVAKTHNVFFDGIKEQTEDESGNFLMVYREVQFVSDYATLGKFLADLENSPIFLRIVSLDAEKNPDTGKVKVTVKVSTIFPKLAKGGA